MKYRVLTTFVDAAGRLYNSGTIVEMPAGPVAAHVLERVPDDVPAHGFTQPHDVITPAQADALARAPVAPAAPTIRARVLVATEVRGILYQPGAVVEMPAASHLGSNLVLVDQSTSLTPPARAHIPHVAI